MKYLDWTYDSKTMTLTYVDGYTIVYGPAALWEGSQDFTVACTAHETLAAEKQARCPASAPEQSARESES
jgi:hypothetical protein